MSVYKIIDSNCLQDASARQYLLDSRENHVVLTDYVGIEAYKDGSLSDVLRSFATLSEFPRQVIVLTGTQPICGRVMGSETSILEMVDAESTASFPRFIEALTSAGAGNSRILSQFKARAAAAAAFTDNLTDQAKTLAPLFEALAAQLPRDLLVRLRRHEALPLEMLLLMRDQIVTFVARMAVLRPELSGGLGSKSFRNQFMFRFGLVAYLLCIEWISWGGAQSVSPSRLRNDAVDVVLVTYATYCDGIISKDKKVLRLHSWANQWLKSGFSDAPA